MEFQILIGIAVVVILLTTWILARRSGTEEFNINPDQNTGDFANQKTRVVFKPDRKFELKTEIKFKNEETQEIEVKHSYEGFSAQECYAEAKQYIDIGSYQKAIEPLKRAVLLKPGYADAYFMMGMAYNKMGAYEESIEPLREAVRILPDNVSAYCALGIAYNALNRYDEAINVFNQAIEIKKRDPEAHFGLGLTYYRRGSIESAKKEYETLLSINRYLAKELLNLINKTENDDKYQENKKILQAAASLSDAVSRRENIVSFKNFFTKDDEMSILEAVKQAESRTSGEIRVRIEKNAGADIMRTARSAFEALGMRKTKLRNGIMFLLAVEDRKFVVLGDDGINNKVPANFWDKTRDIVQENFRKNLFAQGLAEGVKLAGEQLAAFFPYEKEDVNELPDAISYADKAGE